MNLSDKDGVCKKSTAVTAEIFGRLGESSNVTHAIASPLQESDA
jgi:hypothetical protein